MKYNQPTPEGKDPVLWEIAQKRANFKRHLVSYCIVNAFLWCIWIFSSHESLVNINELNIPNFRNHYPWPVWPMLGWGIGLAFSYANAYIFPKNNLVEDEYQKLNTTKK